MALYIFFCYYFNKFLFCYVLHFLHTDPYENVGKKRKENEAYIHRKHTQLHADEKEREKETDPCTFFSIYMKKLIIINTNK